ncbi:hypothetical protein Nepgr_012992 [Nepenthes gracilis]|uniref:Uncharacterized protein n=1 Tax=Nepenthes gracilis TaxID=150966 RepID=A0AAD3SI34_NEPGR|nr:hypothetical protein Nepgr_012992 [Nepenthes gracilis]
MVMLNFILVISDPLLRTPAIVNEDASGDVLAMRLQIQQLKVGEVERSCPASIGC